MSSPTLRSGFYCSRRRGGYDGSWGGDPQARAGPGERVGLGDGRGEGGGGRAAPLPLGGIFFFLKKKKKKGGVHFGPGDGVPGPL